MINLTDEICGREAFVLGKGGSYDSKFYHNFPVNKAYVKTAGKYIYFEDNVDTVRFLNENRKV